MKRNLMYIGLLQCCAIMIFTNVQKGSAFSIVDYFAEPNKNPHHVDSKILLKCISNSAYEHCTWRHRKKACRFDWNKHHNGLKESTNCDSFNGRVKFTGNYDTHECGIELNSVARSDAGVWTCEMESATTWKKSSGEIKSKTIKITVISGPTNRITSTKAPPAINTTSSTLFYNTRSISKFQKADPKPGKKTLKETYNLTTIQSNLSYVGNNSDKVNEQLTKTTPFRMSHVFGLSNATTSDSKTIDNIGIIEIDKILGNKENFTCTAYCALY